MVCINSGHLVSRQFPVRKERSVSVNDLMIKKCELCKHPRVSVDNSIIIHYFAEAENTRISYERVHIVGGEHASVVIDIRRRYARRQHHKYICRGFLCLVEDVIDSVSSGYVACFMWVNNEGCGSVGGCCCYQFSRSDHC